jgi:ElaB/YqjD/DUF883 family membrane-anchored ribosome-binding protein
MENEKANSTVEQAMDQGREVADKASQAIKDSYKAAQRYAGDFDLGGWVRREPWFALAAAFAIGYVAAAAIRRIS